MLDLTDLRPLRGLTGGTPVVPGAAPDNMHLRRAATDLSPRKKARGRSARAYLVKERIKTGDDIIQKRKRET